MVFMSDRIDEFEKDRKEKEKVIKILKRKNFFYLIKFRNWKIALTNKSSAQGENVCSSTAFKKLMTKM